MFCDEPQISEPNTESLDGSVFFQWNQGFISEFGDWVKMLTATPLGALQPRVSFGPSASRQPVITGPSQSFDPVVPPSVGTNARCVGGAGLVSLLVPDALFICDQQLSNHLVASPTHPVSAALDRQPSLVMLPRHWVVSANKPRCCPVCDRLGKQERKRNRQSVQRVWIPSCLL